MAERWFFLDINPEPWAIGPVGYSRRNGKMSAYVGQNKQLDSFKKAVVEELGSDHEMIVGKFKLRMFFWRNQAEYTTPQARTHRKHEADTTNLQKALEDALQGVLFKNDKDTKDIRSAIVEQGPDVNGCIAFSIEPMGPTNWMTDIPDDIFMQVINHQTAGPDNSNVNWPDDEDEGSDGDIPF